MFKVKGTVIAFLISLIFGLIIGGCGSEPKDPTRFYANEFDYSIKFPEGWEIEI